MDNETVFNLTYADFEMVYVYFNLHKKLWSIKNVKSGLVQGHVDSIVLTNAKLKVSESGRKRVLRDKRKNVHAGIKGEVLRSKFSQYNIENDFIEVTYNPYLYDSFVIKSSGEKITQAKTVLMHNKKVFVTNKF